MPFFSFRRGRFEAHFWRDLGPTGGLRNGILGQIFIEKLSRNHRGIEVPFFCSRISGWIGLPRPFGPGRDGPGRPQNQPRNYGETIEKSSRDRSAVFFLVKGGLRTISGGIWAPPGALEPGFWARFSSRNYREIIEG